MFAAAAIATHGRPPMQLAVIDKLVAPSTGELAA
jgi:hypothetical protein